MCFVSFMTQSERMQKHYEEVRLAMQSLTFAPWVEEDVNRFFYSVTDCTVVLPLRVDIHSPFTDLTVRWWPDLQ